MPDLDKKPDPEVVYSVMDRTAIERPNVHDFFDEGRKLRQFKFEPGTPLRVPRYVAERCSQINKGQPDNPVFVVSTGDGLELDTDVFGEMPIDKLLDEVSLSLPSQSAALRKKLDDFADTAQRQLAKAAKDAETDADLIVQLRGELADAKAAGAVGIPLGSCVATYAEMVQPALLERAKARPGFDQLRANPSKDEVVTFLTDGDTAPAPVQPKAEADTNSLV